MYCPVEVLAIDCIRTEYITVAPREVPLSQFALWKVKCVMEEGFVVESFLAGALGFVWGVVWVD